MSNYSEVHLGTIQNLSLKDVWALEEKHFTPWLSRNLDVLGDAVGISMECLQTELQAGDGQRHVDMLIEMNGRDLAVIENQYGKADPSHGWRTLHYALALGAKVAFWIFEDISSDDERLISFLNEHPGIDIIGVQARVYKIDDSLPAVDFRVIPPSQDSLDRVSLQCRSSRDVSEKELFYGDYFPDMINKVYEKMAVKGGYGANKGHWNYYCSWNSALGCRNPWEAAFNQRRSSHGYYYVHLMLRDKDAKENFHYLHQHEAELMKGLPSSVRVEFDFEPARKSQKIKFIHPMSDLTVEKLSREERQELIAWTCDVLPKLQDNLTTLVERQTVNLVAVS
jgi:hypothetical protein